MTKQQLREAAHDIAGGQRKGVVHVGGKSITITVIPRKYHFGTRWVAVDDTYPPPQLQILYPTPQKAFLTRFRELQFLAQKHD